MDVRLNLGWPDIMAEQILHLIIITDNTMSTSNEMWWLFCARRLHYTLVKLKRYLLHMRVCTRAIKSVVYGRNEL